MPNNNMNNQYMNYPNQFGMNMQNMPNMPPYGYAPNQQFMNQPQYQNQNMQYPHLHRIVSVVMNHIQVGGSIRIHIKINYGWMVNIWDRRCWQ